MAYYTPRQQTNGKWFYTCQNGDTIFTLECCKNCDGHDSPEEASECRRQYNIKTAQSGWSDELQRKCAVCGEWTQSYKIVDREFPTEYYLCSSHNNVEILDILTRPVEKIVAKNKNKKPEGFIPNTFEEAVDYLVAQKVPVKNPLWHHSGGMSLRNDWGLWHNATPLAKWFTEKKLFHGDDRSGLLSSAVEAKMQGKEFDVDLEIKRYQDWWLNQYGEKHNLANMEKDFHSYALTEEDYD